MNLYESVNKNLKETTRKELDAKRDALREKRKQALTKAGDKNPDDTFSNLKNRIPKNVYNKLEKEDSEISCISMLHSILTYGGSRDVEELVKDRYLQDYIAELGIDKVKELAAQEIEEYNNAEILKDVHTDSEGVTYNSTRFRDDDVPVEIYQIKEPRDCPYGFMGWKYAKDKINFRDDYELVSTIELPNSEHILDKVFEVGNLNKDAFNIIKPMRSISVSDIIKIGNKKYYVDSYGFEELPGEYKGKINEAEKEKISSLKYNKLLDDEYSNLKNGKINTKEYLKKTTDIMDKYTTDRIERGQASSNEPREHDTNFFTLFQDEVISKIPNTWNNANNKEREDMVRPLAEKYWEKYGKEMTIEDLEDLWYYAEQSNYHTPALVLEDIIHKDTYNRINNKRVNESEKLGYTVYEYKGNNYDDEQNKKSFANEKDALRYIKKRLKSLDDGVSITMLDDTVSTVLTVDKTNANDYDFTGPSKYINDLSDYVKDLQNKIKEAEEEYHPNGVIDDIKRRGTGDRDIKSPVDLNTGVLPIVNVDQYSRQEDFYSMEETMNDEDGDGYADLEPGDEGYYEITRDQIDEATMKYAPEVIEEFINEVLPGSKVTATGMYHPTAYNFAIDEMNFDLSFDENKYAELEKATVADPEFAKYLKEHYSSYDGFFSYLADNLDEFYQQDFWKRLVQVIMFNLRNYEDEMRAAEDDLWYEKIRQDLY